MLASCTKCGTILEYDRQTGCIKCPRCTYDSKWIEAEYNTLGWGKQEIEEQGSPANWLVASFILFCECVII